MALGGILHALRLPFTGITVGSASVLCLCLLGVSVARPRDILRGLAIVLAVKAAVTPHAPAGAFLAVAFQGLAAWFLFRFVGRRAATCVFLGVVALVQSALQKIVFMTILYGMPLWKAVDVLAESALGFFGIQLAEGTDPSKWLIIAYLGVHLVAGLFVGLIGARLPAWIREGLRDPALPEVIRAGKGEFAHPRAGNPRPSRRKRLVKRATGLVLAACAVGIVAGLESQGQGPGRQAAQVLLRVFAVALIYLFIVSPLVRIGMRRLTRREKETQPGRISRILTELPCLKPMAFTAWKATNGTRLREPLRVLKLFLAAVLYQPESPQPATGNTHPPEQL